MIHWESVCVTDITCDGTDCDLWPINSRAHKTWTSNGMKSKPEISFCGKNQSFLLKKRDKVRVKWVYWSKLKALDA